MGAESLLSRQERAWEKDRGFIVGERLLGKSCCFVAGENLREKNCYFIVEREGHMTRIVTS